MINTMVEFHDITIEGCATAATVTPNAVVFNSDARIKIGKFELTEKKLEEIMFLADFIEHFIQQDERARELYTAMLAKKRILG